MTPMDSHQSDFTFANYCAMLDLARRTYRFVTPQEALSATDRCVIWRHDIDLSLHRAERLARAEAERGLVATYFVNPRSDFYNLLEPEQDRRVRRILALGHRIGLHFDAAFRPIPTEADLDACVAREARWLGEWFEVQIEAFSFHNPTTSELKCDKERYGGLVNCYSARLARDFSYCSDSNGYWRYRRLPEVLAAATDRCLQVLTHPGLWQDKPMPPRARVFRALYGRARRVLDAYDETLETAGRTNLSGGFERFRFLKTLDPERYRLFDYLWNHGWFETLFMELHRLQGTSSKEAAASSERLASPDQWRAACLELCSSLEARLA